MQVGRWRFVDAEEDVVGCVVTYIYAPPLVEGPCQPQPVTDRAQAWA